MKKLMALAALSSTMLLTGCGEKAPRRAVDISPQEFVNALNYVNGYSGPDSGYQIVKSVGETKRFGYFVMYNPDRGFFGDYQAVNLSFIRDIEVEATRLGLNNQVARAFDALSSAQLGYRDEFEDVDIGSVGCFFANCYESESDGLYQYNTSRSTRDQSLQSYNAENDMNLQAAVAFAYKYDMELGKAYELQVVKNEAESDLNAGVPSKVIKKNLDTAVENITGVSTEELSTIEGLRKAQESLGMGEIGALKLSLDLAEFSNL